MSWQLDKSSGSGSTSTRQIHLHVEHVLHTYSKSNTVAEAKKLWHPFRSRTSKSWLMRSSKALLETLSIPDFGLSSLCPETMFPSNLLHPSSPEARHVHGCLWLP